MANLTKFGVPVGDTTTSLLMPKLQYRFRVTFKQLGGVATADTVTHQVVSVTRPTLTHEEVTLDVYNSRIYLAGKHTWEPVTLVVRDDISNNVITMVDQQMQNQIDHHNQSAPIAGAQYKFSTVIDTLDGGNGDVTSPVLLDSWSLGGCWITSTAYNESNYATSDAMTINMTIRYDNAIHMGTDGSTKIAGQSIASSVADYTGATAGA
ncbi:MAG: hypothetical protein CXT73_01235 [Methanobacteriota archaeon]|jgi:hypothetical protein|nr:MAG: hypothetical protein CXT73_01235 [Euryarchaeota archaeon]|tara:strand:- start:962 stop:1585 length:624 start_codon:yes stop_codon:yes gene_type:complete